MNKLKRTAALFAVILMILMLFPLNAFAASASVRASASSVKVGDTVTVTVTISGNNIGAASGTFSYNSSVLQFVSGSGASKPPVRTRLTPPISSVCASSLSVPQSVKSASFSLSSGTVPVQRPYSCAVRAVTVIRPFPSFAFTISS